MSSCPRTHSSRERLKYKPNQPQFFKIILDDRQRKLAIPRKFVQIYREKLSDCVILKVPSGKYWNVDIVKTNGRIWLEKGWHKFMKYYSIVNGSFLVFRYDESNSGFDVIIFDSTCTEIDYPYTSFNEASPELKVPKVESDDIPVKISGQFSPSRKRKEKASPLSSSRPHKKMKNAEKFSNITGKGTSVAQKKKNQSLKLKEKSKVISRASSNFRSQNPTFQIKMKPSHVRDWSSRPSIPPSFARKYMKNKKGVALINVLDGRTWPVKYSSRVNRTRLTHSGWNRFVWDCYLKVGDVCTFELIDPHKTLFRVVISRSKSGAIFGSSSKQSTDKKTKMIPRKNSSSKFVKAAGNLTSGNPFFKVLIKSSHPDRYKVNVPVGFFKNLKQTTENAKLVLYGNMWYVKMLLYRNHGCGTLSAGWAAFARENCLKEGDVCTFELIDAQELLIKVSISRHSSTN